jgi:hypothetical protein
MADTITIGTDGWVQPSEVRKYVAQFRDRLGDDNGPITDNEIIDWITDRFRQMNGAVTPLGITLTSLDADAMAEAVLRRINKMGAVIDVVRAMYLGASNADPSVLRNIERDYDREIQRLRSGYYALGGVQAGKESTVRITAAMKASGDDADPDITLTKRFG